MSFPSYFAIVFPNISCNFNSICNLLMMLIIVHLRSFVSWIHHFVTLKRDLELVMGDADQEKCWSQNYKLESESLHLFFPVLQFPYDYLRVSKASVVRAQPRKEDVLFLREVQVPIQEVPELCQTLRGCLGVPAASKCQDAIQAYSGCTPVPALEDCFLQNQEFCFCRF